MQGYTGRMVGTVDLGVTVQTSPAQHEAVAKVISNNFTGESCAGVPGRRVALLAEQRWPFPE